MTMTEKLTCPICGVSSQAESWIIHGSKKTSINVYHARVYEEETSTAFYGATCPKCKIFIEFWCDITRREDEPWSEFYRRVQKELSDPGYEELKKRQGRSKL